MQITVEYTITDDLSPHLANVIRNMADRTPVLNALSIEMEAMAKETFDVSPELRPIPWAPMKKKSGAPLVKSGMLLQSITETDRTSDSVSVGTDRPYAVFQFTGTKPYRIKPKNKKAIRWPGAKHPVKYVDHPGLPPRPFLPVHPQTGDIVPAAAERLQAVIQDTVDRMIEES